MRPLSAVPFVELQVGDDLLSANGREGKIVALYTDYRYKVGDEKHRCIRMRWTGVHHISDQPHALLDKVNYLGRK